MFARKLLTHLELHGDQLSEGLRQKIVASGNCTELLKKVPADEQKRTMRDIYRQLTTWVLKDMRSVDEDYYVNLGARRFGQGVPFSEVLAGVCAAREYFWEYIAQETLLDEPTDFWGSVKLLNAVDCCFDRALRFTAMGYEKAERDRLAHADHAA